MWKQGVMEACGLERTSKKLSERTKLSSAP